jgi:hypothetical protein
MDMKTLLRLVLGTVGVFVAISIGLNMLLCRILSPSDVAADLFSNPSSIKRVQGRAQSLFPDGLHSAPIGTQRLR